MVSFLLQAVVISLSGVLAPGPVTAATLATGTRFRHAGAMIAVGHGVIEFPLMLLIMAGIGVVFRQDAVRVGIGLAGGLFLLLMGGQMLAGLRNGDAAQNRYVGRSPLWIGIALTAGNPYFLLWWATVGLALASRAMEFGAWGFALFAVVHWLCDLAWLEALSQASFNGSRLLGAERQRHVLAVCSLALMGMGLRFMADAGGKILV